MLRGILRILARLVPRRSQSTCDPYQDEFRYGIWKPGFVEKITLDEERARGLGLTND